MGIQNTVKYWIFVMISKKLKFKTKKICFLINKSTKKTTIEV